jgi:ABC-2 type transport system ATP-binding protein
VVVADDAAAVNALLVGAGVRVDSIGPLRRDLEDVVLRASEAS